MSLEVINLVLSVHELELTLLHLLLIVLQFLLQVHDVLDLRSLELPKLMGLSSGGLL
jgi:hypothetical protein